MKKILILFGLGVCLASSTLHAQETDFATLDIDADGEVSLEEFRDYAKGRLPDFDDLEAFAEAVDADEDGVVSEDEFNDRINVLSQMQESLQEMEAEDDADADNADAGEGEEDEESHDAEATEQVQAAIERFNEISALLKEGDWDSAAEFMTESSRDELAVQVVATSFALTGLEMPSGFEIPGIADAQEAVDEVREVYGLNELDVDFGNIIEFAQGEEELEDEGSGDGESDGTDEGEDADNEDEGLSEREVILAALDAKGNRWDIVKAIKDAMEESPLNFQPLCGEVIKSETTDDETVMLTVKPEIPAPPEGQDGVQLQVMMPPSVLRFRLEDEQWQFDGIDQERTERAAREYMDEFNPMEFEFDSGSEF